jgi:protein-S-isoprenylcysteine O-methyltransferase Ste14
MKKTTSASFAARGGWWVLAQVPVLAQAAIVPGWSGAMHIDRLSGWTWAGGLLMGAGIALSVAGLVGLGSALTPFPRPLAGATLRQRGVYRFVRHPVYGGILLATGGWTLLWSSWPGALSAALTAVFFDRKAAREERWLVEQYKDYAAYRRRVKKFLPGLY